MKRIIMKRIAIYFVILGLAAGVSAGQEMTLDDAVRIGLRGNYSIQIARNTIQLAQNNRGRGTAGFLPTLDASGSYQLINTDQTTNSPFSFGDTDTEALTGNLSLNWTLFDGFRMFAERGRYNALARQGAYQGRAVIENTVVAISQAYFALVTQEQLLDVAREARDISADRLEKERVRNEVGGASTTDLLNARVAFNTDEATHLNQELQVALARKELNILLGRKPLDSLQVTREIVVPSYTMTATEVLVLAEKDNSSYLAIREGKTAADRQVRSARAAFYPRLSLTAGYAYGDRTVERADGSSVITESTDASVGLAVSLNIFNGRRDRIAAQNAILEARNLALALQEERNRLAGLVQDKHLTLLKRLQLIELEEQNASAARQNLELQQDRYRIGAASSLEFRDAQVNLIRSRTALIVARYEARISYLEIQQLTGSIDIK